MLLFKKKKKKVEEKPAPQAAPKKEAPKAAAKSAPKKETSKAAPKKATAKSAPKKEERDLSNATRSYHVAKREDGKWQVKYAGGQKAIKLFDTQAEAVEYTKKMANNQEGAMLVHNSKGKNKGKIKSK